MRNTELAWLQQGLGPSTAKAVVERAEHWYGDLFVESGLVETSYRITLPSDADVAARRRPLAARHAAPVVLGRGSAWR